MMYYWDGIVVSIRTVAYENFVPPPLEMLDAKQRDGRGYNTLGRKFLWIYRRRRQYPYHILFHRIYIWYTNSIPNLQCHRYSYYYYHQ